MTGLNELFAVLSVIFSCYFMYAYYMAKYKNEIAESLLLPKGVDVNKCKDIKGYCREVQLPVLVLGIITLIYGAMGMYHAFVRNVDTLLLIMVGVVLVALVIYCVYIKKINKKYFNI